MGASFMTNQPPPQKKNQKQQQKKPYKCYVSYLVINLG